MDVLKVEQGHSVEFCGIWFNQGQEFAAPSGTKFEVRVPDLDKDGNQKGMKTISAVKKIREVADASEKESKKAVEAKTQKDGEG